MISTMGCTALDKREGTLRENKDDDQRRSETERETAKQQRTWRKNGRQNTRKVSKDRRKRAKGRRQYD